jgi:hypothetical protein
MRTCLIRRGSGHGASERWFGQSGETRHSARTMANLAVVYSRDEAPEVET